MAEIANPTKMYKLLSEVASRQDYCSALNFYAPGKFSYTGVVEDSSINGIKVTFPPATSSGTVTAPGHIESQDWEYCRIFGLEFNTTSDDLPYWITVSGELYTDDTEEFEISIEMCDSARPDDRINTTEGLGWKTFKVTTTHQKFVLYGNTTWFNKIGNGYIDFEGPPTKSFYVKDLMIQRGKVSFPTYAESLETCMMITDTEIQTLINKLSL